MRERSGRVGGHSTVVSNAAERGAIKSGEAAA
jgi:hypothetical protein